MGKKADEDGEAEKPEGVKARAVRWNLVPEDSLLFKAGCRISIPTDGDVQSLVWHAKGNYCAAVSPKALAASNQCIIHALQQQPLKHLVSGAKWISSVSVHPGGDHVVVGSYDRRVVWFDLDFGSTPYKTLQYHDRAVRNATFHPKKYPLLAVASDDATVSILHAKVFSDLMQNPMIVPVKRLRGHAESGFWCAGLRPTVHKSTCTCECLSYFRPSLESAPH